MKSTLRKRTRLFVERLEERTLFTKTSLIATSLPWLPPSGPSILQSRRLRHTLPGWWPLPRAYLLPRREIKAIRREVETFRVLFH